MKQDTENLADNTTDAPEDLEFNEADLEVIEISDDGMEAVDLNSAKAKKEAKKTAKKLRTPEENKLHRRKQILISGATVLVFVLVLLVIPFTRWTLLNAIGFRGNLEVTAIDQTSKKPIAKASVKLEDGSFGLTNNQGLINFAGAKLGKRSLLVQKPGYADLALQVTNNPGSTKNKVELKAIGIKLDVDVKNWLSGAVIEGATVSFKESSALSDKAGRASLIIAPTDSAKIALTISAPGYVSKTFDTDVDVASREVLLVSAQKDYFISKRDGKFDVFASNLDGSGQQKIIEATGKEDESLTQLSINRSNKQAILVATRDGKVENGKIVAGVYLVDLEKATLKKVDEGSDIQLLDWSDNSIAYTKSIPQLGYDDPSLTRLVTFNPTTGKLSEVQQANYFGVALMAQNKLFYIPADAYRAVENGVLTSQDVLTGAKKSYLTNKVIRYANRVSFGTLELQDTAGVNYELQIGLGTTKQIDHRPATTLSFATSPNGQQVVWNDRRDGQGALLTRSVKTTDEKTVTKAGGLTAPVRFVTDDLAVVRIVTSQETADYVVSLASGKISKVVDVSNIGANSVGSL